MLSRRQLQGFVRAPFDFNTQPASCQPETRSAAKRETNPFYRNQAAFATHTRRAVVPHQQVSHCFVVFNNAMRANAGHQRRARTAASDKPCMRDMLIARPLHAFVRRPLRRNSLLIPDSLDALLETTLRIIMQIIFDG